VVVALVASHATVDRWNEQQIQDSLQQAERRRVTIDPDTEAVLRRLLTVPGPL
jgi:hypothetical protein